MVSRPNAKTKEARREEILDAALQEFAERGLPRRVDRGRSPGGPASRSRTCSASSGRRRSSSGPSRRAASARRSRCSSGRRKGCGARRRSRRWARRTSSGWRPIRSGSAAQMQAYAACDDPEIREAVRHGFGDLVAYAERVSGLPAAEVTRFFAMGMLLNVFASMGQLDEGAEPWAQRLLQACLDEARRRPRLFFRREVSDDSQRQAESASSLWAFVLTSLAGFMVTLDNLVVTTALPVIRERPRRRARRARVDRQRLHADLRGAAPDRRRARRPVRPPPDARDRPRASSRVSSAAAALAPTILALDVARALPGRRRRDRHAADADDPLRRRPPGEARPRARRLGRHHRASRSRSARSSAAPSSPGISWQWIFWLNVPIGLVLIPLVLLRLDESHGPCDRLDLPGLALAGVGLLGIVWGLVRGNALGWGSAPVLGGDPRRPRRDGALRRSGSSARRRRCCRCASSATGRSRSRTAPRSSSRSGCSARSSCSRSTSRPCRATRRSRPGSGSCRGRRCR